MSRLGVAVVKQYERGVVFRLGKLRNVRDPGIRFMIPLVDRMEKVSLRTVTMPIPSQQIITKDNVSIGVAAVAYFRRVDPVKSIVEIENVESPRRPDRPDHGAQHGRSLHPRPGASEPRRSTRRSRRSSTSPPSGGAWSCSWSSSRTSSCPTRCSGRWPSRPRPSARSGPRSSRAEGEALSAGKLAEAADVIAQEPDRAAAAQPAGPRRDRGREELDDHLPRPVPREHPEGLGVPRTGASRRLGGGRTSALSAPGHRAGGAGSLREAERDVLPLAPTPRMPGGHR